MSVASVWSLVVVVLVEVVAVVVMVVVMVVVVVVMVAVASHLKAHGAEAAVLHLDVGHPVKAGAHLRQKEIVRKS